MSERCNNSACFSVEIKGTSDICVTFVVYACGKSILGVRTHEKDTADPYHFKCGRFTVQASFSAEGATLEECIKGILR